MLALAFDGLRHTTLEGKIGGGKQCLTEDKDERQDLRTCNAFLSPTVALTNERGRHHVDSVRGIPFHG